MNVIAAIVHADRQLPKHSSLPPFHAFQPRPSPTRRPKGINRKRAQNIHVTAITFGPVSIVDILLSEAHIRVSHLEDWLREEGTRETPL